MKNRLIVAGIGIPALLAVIFFAPLWGWAIVVGVMASFSAWELTHTVLGERFRTRFGVYAGVAAFAIPLGAVFGYATITERAAMYALFFVMFLEKMIALERREENLPFSDLAVVLFAGIVLPLLLTALVRLGMNRPKPAFILLTFVIVWITDSGAFFVGNAMGTGLCFSMQEIAAYQAEHGCLIAKLSMIPAAIAFALVIPGETGSHPFDTAEAETEICEGMLAEYSGSPLAVFKLTHAVKVLTLSSLFVALFLGGLRTGIVAVDGVILFALCVVVVAIFISLVHAVTARLKIEQVFKYYWTVVSGLALVSLVLAWYGL